MTSNVALKSALAIVGLVCALGCGDTGPAASAQRAKETLSRLTSAEGSRRHKDNPHLQRLKRERNAKQQTARKVPTSDRTSRGGEGDGRGGLGLRGVGSGGGGRASSAPTPGGTFQHAGTNPFTAADEDGLSTFAIDVDTGSFRFARGFLAAGRRPPSASVRVEEWVNAMRYEYPAPSRGADAFRIHLVAAPSPLAGDRHLLRVALQGRHVSAAERKPAHLTFLVDVSGSMAQADKLPLVRESLHLLVKQLRHDDSVTLVTYAGGTRLVLPAISAREQDKIHAAIAALKPGGGTDMGSAMELAYREAALQLSDERSSRVMVLSDGDANIGSTSHERILSAVRGWVSEGVTLSTIGFGRGNYNDHLMEGLADAGNGNYTYLDSRDAALQHFGEGLIGTLEVIAQDAKVQVAFNDDVVRGYRLIGYENRAVRDQDFASDRVDGGELGAGHAVTALYELDLKGGARGEIASVHVRAKAPRGRSSTETSARITTRDLLRDVGDLDADARFAAGVALVAEILRESPYVRHRSLEDARRLLAGAVDGSFREERARFVRLVEALLDAEAPALAVQ